MTDKKLPGWLQKLGIVADANAQVHTDEAHAPVSAAKPKAPPPPKGPKNSRGFGGSQVRRTSGRGR